jgi:hypothetical protein
MTVAGLARRSDQCARRLMVDNKVTLIGGMRRTEQERNMNHDGGFLTLRNPQTDSDVVLRILLSRSVPWHRVRIGRAT